MFLLHESFGVRARRNHFKYLIPFFIVNVFDQIKGIFLVSEMEPNQCLPPSQMFTDIKIIEYR